MASTISPSPLHLPLSAGFRHLYSPPLPAAAAAVEFRHHRSTTLVVRATAVIPTIDRADADKVHRLKSNYLEKIVPTLSDEFGYTNIHQVPKLVKIVVNCGMGDASQNSKGLEAVIRELARITGQKPVKTTAKNALASFKIREGQTIGVMITLRKNYMYSFLDRLINLALPRVRDFQGMNANSFDGNGNFNMGFHEQSVFPEIKYDALVARRGMDVCISTTAKTDKEAFRLLSLMGMPFKEGSSPSEKIPRKKKKSFNIDQGKGNK